MMLIATKTIQYAGQRLPAGAAFSARRPADERLLIAIGKARVATEDDLATGGDDTQPNPDPAPAKPKPATKTTSNKAMTAAKPESKPARRAPRRGKYATRSTQADD
jgi:hypothetical protein